MIELEQVSDNLFRFNYHGQRWYYTLDPVTLYPSVTTILDATTPTSYAVKELIGKFGMDGFHKFMREKADYGTLFHIFCSHYFEFGEISDMQMEAFAHDFGRVDFRANYISLKKDMLSIMKFKEDYDVTPIVNEKPMAYNDGNLKFAGTIDLIAEMTINKQRKLAIIDFKSGKHGFYESHGMQLGFYQILAGQNGHSAVDLINVSPKDWQKEPTYNFKNWGKDKALDKIKYLINLFLIDFEEPKEILVFENNLNSSHAYSKINIADYVSTFSKNFIN